MQGIERELVVFAVAVLSGGGVRLAYGCLSCFRDIIHHSQIVIGVQDLLFWIGTAIYLFVQIYQTSDGRIRWHFVLGIVLGAVFMENSLVKLEKLRKKIYTRKKKKS